MTANAGQGPIKCRRGLHEMTPENTGPKNRCMPCRREANRLYRRAVTATDSGRLTSILRAAVQRCDNPRDSNFKNYGARGISICREWKENESAFVAWAKRAGWRRWLLLDRIDNDGNYEPRNCRFVSARESVSNTRKQKNRDLPVGVRRSRARFSASIERLGQAHHLGTFDSAEEAGEAYRIAAAMLIDWRDVRRV